QLVSNSCPINVYGQAWTTAHQRRPGSSETAPACRGPDRDRTAWDPCLRQFDDAPHGSFRIVRRGAQGFGPTAVVEVGGVAASLLTRLTANWRGGLSPTSLLAPSRQPS